MSKFLRAITGGLVVGLGGILANIPLAVALGILAACGMILLALLSYFETLP